MQHLYPIYLDLREKSVGVVGGGKVAERKILALQESQALVKVVSPEVTDKISELASSGAIQWEAGPYHSDWLEGAWLVIAATGVREVNETVYQDSLARKIFCNVVDVPYYCSFQVPSVLKRGALKIAISTGGASPGLARRIRERLEPLFGCHYGRVLEALFELRRFVKAQYPDDSRKRAQLLKGFVHSEAMDLAEKGDMVQFEKLLEQWKAKYTHRV